MPTMTEQEVIDLMKSSKNADEWDANCNKVQRAFGGYPSFWYGAIVASQLVKQVAAGWNAPRDGDIHITRLER